ncbi:MAG TPA: hypothetical protein VLU47_18545 [Blastocatellia bacterium]|nr:hypothetical protein [Blastocatellia bacterium]
MESNSAKKEIPEEQRGLLHLLGRLSTSGLTILGVLYLTGYVIANGYQAEYLNYSANVIQVKHLAAGLLYAFVTLVQIWLVAAILVFVYVDER